jgi:serine O-acetyltransferase
MTTFDIETPQDTAISELTPADFPSWRELVREDFEHNEREWTSAGVHALIVHRFGRHARDVPGVRGTMLRKLHRALFVLVRNVYGIELPASAEIGRRLRITHQHGIIVNGKTIVGDDCAIANNVTLGIGVYGKESVPRIGNRVSIGPGAIIVGRITVGDDVKISPHSLVMSDVPAGAHVVASPARVLRLHADGDGTSA